MLGRSRCSGIALRRVRDRVGSGGHHDSAATQGTRTLRAAHRIWRRLTGSGPLVHARGRNDRSPPRSRSPCTCTRRDHPGLVGRLCLARGIGFRSSAVARNAGLADRPIRAHAALRPGMSHPRDPGPDGGLDRSVRESSRVPDPDRRSRNRVPVLAASPAPFPGPARARRPGRPRARGVPARERDPDSARAKRTEGRAGRDPYQFGTATDRSAEQGGPGVWRDRERTPARWRRAAAPPDWATTGIWSVGSTWIIPKVSPAP